MSDTSRKGVARQAGVCRRFSLILGLRLQLARARVILGLVPAGIQANYKARLGSLRVSFNCSCASPRLRLRVLRAFRPAADAPALKVALARA